MGIAETILFVAILIISVIVHEISHGYMAEYLGDPTARLKGRLTLNPVPHIDTLGSIIVPGLLALLPGSLIFGWAKPVPYNPHNLNSRYGNALVAAAGPASNFFIAGVAAVVFRLTPIATAGAAGTFVLAVTLINVVLAVFNLVPIPPLDGSKILFDFLPARLNYIREALEQYGFVILVFFIFFAIEIISPIIFGLFRLLAGVAGIPF